MPFGPNSSRGTALTVAIKSHTPHLVRGGDALVLGGAGFANSGNTVTIDGLAATVGAESETSVSVTVPGGVRTDRFVPVVITHATDGTTSTRQLWIKASKAALQSFLMALQNPGEYEDWGTASSLEHEEDIEAKDVEDLHELLQYLPLDLLTTPGDMVGRNANGVGRVTNGPIGSVVMLDRATSGGASGINHRTRRAGFLTWGRSVSNSTPTLMAVHGTANQGATAGAEQRTPDGGKLALLVVYVDRQGGTRELDQVRLLRNGSLVHDSTAGLGLAAQQQYVAQVFDDAGDVAATDRWSVEITGDGGTSSIDCVAALVAF